LGEKAGRLKDRYFGIFTEQALEALHINEIEILQLPSNVLDRRFEKAGVFEIAENKKKEIYIRSIFLQGLLLMDLEDIPERMSFAKPVIRDFEKFCQRNHISRQDLAIGYFRTRMPQRITFWRRTSGTG